MRNLKRLYSLALFFVLILGLSVPAMAENGTWTVRARVFDPMTGKIKQRSKSTGFKVKDSTKRKAEKVMREIVAEWEKEANAVPVKCDPLFSEYVEKWLKKKSFSRGENTVLSYQREHPH